MCGRSENLKKPQKWSGSDQRIRNDLRSFFLDSQRSPNTNASIGGLTTQFRHGRQVAARARQGFEESLLRKARADIDPEKRLGDDEFAWRYQRWRTLYFKRLRAAGVRKQRIRSAHKRTSS